MPLCITMNEGKFLTPKTLKWSQNKGGVAPLYYVILVTKKYNIIW